MLFQDAVDKAITARTIMARGGDRGLVTEISPRVYSLLHLDFTRGETHEGVLFSCPASAIASIDAFVASGLDKVLDELGYERSEDFLDEVVEALGEIRFKGPEGRESKRLLQHVLPDFNQHDLGYYDQPDVELLASFQSWIFPASAGHVLSSGDFHFMYYWYCTG